MLRTQLGRRTACMAGGGWLVGQRPLLLSWPVHTHEFPAGISYSPVVCSPHVGVVVGPFTECVTMLPLALIPLVELWQQHLPQLHRWRLVLPVPVGPGWAPVCQELIYRLSYCAPAHPGTSCTSCRPNPPAPPAEAPQPLSFYVRLLGYFCSLILRNLRTFPV